MRPVQRTHDAVSLADLQQAIIEFERALPGWWYSIGICSVSRDASCGPDIDGPDASLATEFDNFDSGFHCDDRRSDSTMADALRDVLAQALEAKAQLRETGGVADDPMTVPMRDLDAERALAAAPEAMDLRDKVRQAIAGYWSYLDRNGLVVDDRRRFRREALLDFVVDRMLA